MSVVVGDLFEKLAATEHERWSHWQRYMHDLCTRNDDGTLTIPKASVEHWERLMDTPYDQLTEKEKDSDREQVHRYWHLVFGDAEKLK